MIVTSEHNAVDAATVSAVTRPDVPEVWSLTVVAGGVVTQLRFGSTDERDTFYKELTEAMRKT